MVTIPILNYPSYTPTPAADFSGLGDLANVYRKAEQDRLKQQQDATAQQLAAAGFAQMNGQPGPQAPQTPTGAGWLSQLMGLQQPQPQTQPQTQQQPPQVQPQAAAPQGDIVNTYGRQTSNAESGGPEGNYRAVGPPARSGDRAYGRYQVMGGNIPEWTEQYYGQRLTPQQFLSNPQAQDAVYRGKFGEYLGKYGPEGAHRAWFAGERGMNNPNANDGYHDMNWYMARTGQVPAGGAAPAPYQVASLGAVPPPTAGGAPSDNIQIAARTVAPPNVQQPPTRPPIPPPAGEDGEDASAAQPQMPPPPRRLSQMSPELFGQLYANPNTRPMAAAILSQAMTPKDTDLREINGSLYEYDKTTRTLRKLMTGEGGHWAKPNELPPGTDTSTPVWIDEKGNPKPVSLKDTDLREVNGSLYEYDKNTHQLRKLAGTQGGHWAKPEELPANADPNTPIWIDEKGNPKAVGKPGTNITLDQKMESEESKILSTNFAKRMEKVAEVGDTARSDMAMLQEQGDLPVETGLKAAVQGALAQYGIKVGQNVPAIEAYMAITKKLTPEQRVPGSGSSSDFDAKTFMGSLAQLINTPGGNAIIRQTHMAIANDRYQRSKIADEYLSKTTNPETGKPYTGEQTMKRLSALPDPYKMFKDFKDNVRLNPGSPEDTARQDMFRQRFGTLSETETKDAIAEARQKLGTPGITTASKMAIINKLTGLVGTDNLPADLAAAARKK